MTFPRILSYVLILMTLCIATAEAQLVISEYSASNMNQFPDNFGRFEDWIEIHNAGTEEIDLLGYGISDKDDNPQKWVIPHSIPLPPGGYQVVWCSGRDYAVGRKLHTNFKLTQTANKDHIVLTDPFGTVLESSPVEITLLDHSRVKTANGDWAISETPTPNSGSTSELRSNYTAAPSFSISAGTFTEAITVDITNNETNSTLYYTLDGNLPTRQSAPYAGPITIAATAVLKARAYSNEPDVLPGKIEFATYFIGDEFTLPVISIAADQVQDLANGDGDLRPQGSIEYFRNGALSSKSYGELNRHGQDSWINDQRSLDWVSRDEMGYSKALDEQLFSYSDRTEYQRFMMRASGDDNYPANGDQDHEGSAHIRDEYVHELAHKGGLKLDIRAVERTIVYLNGDYWGVYSPRERPVDHDYTDYYYDQGKFDLQYILTWGETWTEYGSQRAMDDWEEFRNFMMNNDMGDPDNYQRVKDNMQVLGLIDYMLVNLNTVCSDWINYNTGWWRGLNPEGGHKKWGYILWDNDATFDYYINYSGIPDISPEADPCDIEEISDFMDEFFGNSGFGEIDSTFAEFCPSIMSGDAANDPIFLEVVNEEFGCCFSWSENCQEMYDAIESGTPTGIDPEACPSILNGTSPYPVEDTIFLQVLVDDSNCCDNWDMICQETYDNFAAGIFEEPVGEIRVSEAFGLHEKIFLKLVEESDEFRQLYYSRQADMMNTVFSCDNMLNTLDSMVAIIAPEMPRHIQRWGRSLNEWESNVQTLRDFISERCAYLDDGMTNCYDLSGPYDITLDIFPRGAGDIDFNTIEIKEFPWTGSYFGNMENLIDADPNSDYDFVRWETKSGTPVFPNFDSENASIMLTGQDTLVAIFALETSTEDLVEQNLDFDVFPSPSTGLVTMEYNLKESTSIRIDIVDMLGRELHSFPSHEGVGGQNYENSFDFNALGIDQGTFIVRINTDFGAANRKVIIVK
jgi:hypothetical protein